jgi:hypothetical protein
MRCFATALVLVTALTAAPSISAEVRVDVTRDNSIILVKNEYHLNHGRKPRIRIKGNQHLVVLAFDTQAPAGRLVKSAVLVCGKAEFAIEEVTVSTIQADWDEYRSSALTSGKQAFEGWGRPGARFPAVTGGNGFSLVCQAESTVKNGAYHWRVDPDLIHANAIGAAYGITLHEVRCDYSRNPRIFAREEKARRPYLLLTLGGTEPDPQPPGELELNDKGDPGSLRLSLRAPRRGFAYQVRVNGEPLPRWNIPFVRPGETQSIPIRDLPLEPGQKVTIAVRTVNRIGRRSRVVTIAGTVPKPESLSFPKIAELQRVKLKDQHIYAIPVTDKYDARDNPVGDLPRGYRTRNAVFDGGAIRLAAARGEVVGFQALLKGMGRVELRCNIPGIRTEMHRALYVESAAGRIPDPLVALDGLELSNDRCASVFVDVFVPFDETRNTVQGELSVSDGRRVPINLAVRNFAIPRRASFLCEMNSYGLPDKASEFYRMQKIAYDHRVHCNILHYSHRTAAPGARKCNMDMVMANGRRMNERRYNNISPGAERAYWDDFISVFGPYLSGSCFREGHRGPIPAPGFYLTFHESWPLNVRAYFNGDPDAYDAFNKKPAYARTFVNVMGDFIAVARREGWTHTGFQVYLNNKGKLDDAPRNPWTLDEPTEYWDYRALAYYGDLVQKAKGERCPVPINYRIDISRPQFDRAQLRGKADLWVVNWGVLQNYRRLIADRAERSGEEIWVYGSSNKVEDTNRTIHAWVLDAYRNGAKGVVPWQTVNKDGSALRKADQLGLFIFEKNADGPATIHHSMRLKAYRRAEQDVEYLELLRKRLKLTSGQLEGFIDHYLNLDGDVVTKYSADAGTARYGRLSPEGFRQLREAAAILIERNGDQKKIERKR